MSDSREHPVEILWRMQQEAMAAGHALAEKDQGGQKWGGLAFRVGDYFLVTELTSIIDVLDCPAITPVPGTHSWVMGICNVRGKLFSVVDFGLFLGAAPRGIAREGRILVINKEDLGCTLFVPKIFGLRYFTEDQLGQDTSNLDQAIRPYIDRIFVQGDRTWAVLSLERLITDERFLHVKTSAFN